jgi:hypothetical protein
MLKNGKNPGVSITPKWQHKAVVSASLCIGIKKNISESREDQAHSATDIINYKHNINIQEKTIVNE